ncbi:unannotated protein [freshwater metagenome]|uniref:Unannotated protein n=1 Tax=freshwater metagenome TaxID=449393 RepID=A0A6J7TNZ3_9ZZZZ
MTGLDYDFRGRPFSVNDALDFVYVTFGPESENGEHYGSSGSCRDVGAFILSELGYFLTGF